MRPRGESSFLDYLRQTLPPPGPDVVSDGELLGRFAALRDEDAFRLLVRRHGPMVFGAARRVLRDGHAAEDVFQAAFLVMARRAKSLRRHPAVAAWLYRVTVRIGVRARPRNLPVAATAGTAPDASSLAEQNELRAALDAAVERLPEKLRRTVVLCYFSGHTTEQAARQLGCPKGTVLSRLSAAREKLQKDLTRRGITVSVAALTAALAGEAHSAAVPAALIALTMRIVGPAAMLTPAVLTLAKGAVAMSWIKTSIAAVVMLTAGFGLAIGLGQSGQKTKGERPQNPPNAHDLLTEKEKAREKAERDKLAESDRLIVWVDRNLREISARRLELKMQIYDRQQKLDRLRTGLKSLELAEPRAAACRFMTEIDGDLKKKGIFVANTYSFDNPSREICQVMSGASQIIDQCQKELMRYEEDLRNFEELSAMRIESVKKKLASIGP